MAIRISLDKDFPQLETQMRNVIKDGSSQSADPIFRNVFEDDRVKIIQVNGLISDEEQGIIEDLRSNGFPSRAVSES